MRELEHFSFVRQCLVGRTRTEKVQVIEGIDPF